MKPRAFSIFLTLCLCLTLLPVTAGAANEPVKYIQRTWVNNQVKDTELECIDYTVIDSSTTTWNGSGTTGGWYVVNSSFTIGRRVTVTGDVHLILADGCTLTVNRGIQVAQGNSLTIYGQSGDSGQLIAQNPGTCNAGIGGNMNQTAGTVTIHGGTVEATGGNSAAGIGGGSYGTGGTVTIYGGRVEATGDAFSAGIGGGASYDYSGAGGTVAIYGGTVEATGGSYGAGIGGGAVSKVDGSLSGAAGGQVTISGGRVKATGGNNAAGIGGGGSDGGTPGDSGTFSTGQSGNAVIFANSIADNDDTNGWRGVIFQGNEGQVYGSVALDQDLTIENGRTLTIPAGSALAIQDGVTLTVEQGGTLTVAEGGTVNNYGTVENSGTLLVYGTLNGTVVGSGTVTYKVTGVSLNQNTLNLTAGSSTTLTAAVSPENATDKTVTWESSDNSVATVSGGTVTAVGEGTATITVTTTDGGKTDTCTVTVTPPILVTGVSLNQNTLNLTVGGRATLTATVFPENATDKTVTWESGDNSVATVSGGTVTAVGAGKATITARAGGYTATCTVTVTQPATGVSLNQNTLDLTVGGRATLTATVFPENATDKTVTWESSDNSVATVSGGTVTAVGAGKATITARAGSCTATCAVTVTQPDDGEPTYSVSCPKQVEGGRVTVKKSYAQEGETFSFTVTPHEGWELEELAVLNSRGRALDLTCEGDGAYSFEMPAGAVEITVSFREIDTSPESLPFTDVPGDSWYTEAVRYVYQNGLMAGVSDTAFGPDATTSRSMIATILWRMAGSPVVNYAMDFADVPQGQWYSEAVRWAASEGIVSGYGDTFGTDDPITREQLAVMLYRLAQNEGLGFTGTWAFPLRYDDADQVSDYAYEALCWTTMNGIITGTGDGSTLSPQGQATRAQAAVMLAQFAKQLQG